MAIRHLPADFTEGAAPLLGGASRTLIFKHSPYCGTSALALEEITQFSAAHPDFPIIQIDVIRQRELSQQIAAALGLSHASPQAILVAAGRVEWNASHGHVTAPAIEAAVGSLTSDHAGR